ncbi:YkgJ family cysteine cluster protein [bacterium]|jgi:uncharacterized protein|nr:YkgJ family cysteine cluster protein [bacterium]
MAIADHKADILKAFQCQGTGNCCRIEGVVHVTPQEIDAMAKELGMLGIEFRQKYVKEDHGWLKIADRGFRPDCFLTEDNKCQVYGARPKQCSTYPNWPELWNTDDAFLREIVLCKGLKLAYEKVCK